MKGSLGSRATPDGNVQSEGERERSGALSNDAIVGLQRQLSQVAQTGFPLSVELQSAAGGGSFLN